MGIKKEEKSDCVVDNRTTEYYDLGREAFDDLKSDDLVSGDNPFKYISETYVSPNQQYLLKLVESLIESSLLDEDSSKYLKIGLILGSDIMRKAAYNEMRTMMEKSYAGHSLHF